MEDWCCIAAVNDEVTLEANLASSPQLKLNPSRLTVLRQQASASLAYNKGLELTSERICVFAHQDVYLPKGWDLALLKSVKQLDATDPNWAVSGVYGVRSDGTHVGRVWSSGLGQELNRATTSPEIVESVDELLIILNRNSGVRFDETLPSFHLYGTDIVQTAKSRGLKSYVIAAPVVHNSIPVTTLAGGYIAAHDAMRKKWGHLLPIPTTIGPISKSALDIRIRNARRFGFGRKRAENKRQALRANPQPDPAQIARQLGYE